jgi:hypothetical protein
MRSRSLSSLLFKSGSLIHGNTTIENSKAAAATTTPATKETQELKAKKNLLLLTLNDRE